MHDRAGTPGAYHGGALDHGTADLTHIDSLDVDNVLAGLEFDASSPLLYDEGILENLPTTPLSDTNQSPAKRARVGLSTNDLTADFAVASRLAEAGHRTDALTRLAYLAAYNRDHGELVSGEQKMKLCTLYLEAFAAESLSAEEASALVKAHLPPPPTSGEAYHGELPDVDTLLKLYNKLKNERLGGGAQADLSPIQRRGVWLHTVLRVVTADSPPHLRGALILQAVECPVLTIPPEHVQLMLGRVIIPLINENNSRRNAPILNQLVSTAVRFKIALDPESSARFADEFVASGASSVAAGLLPNMQSVEVVLHALSGGALQLDAERHAALGTSLHNTIPLILRNAGTTPAMENAIEVIAGATLNAIEKAALPCSPGQFHSTVSRLIHRKHQQNLERFKASDNTRADEQRLVRLGLPDAQRLLCLALHDAQRPEPQLPEESLQRLIRFATPLCYSRQGLDEALEISRVESSALLSAIIMARPDVLGYFEEGARRFASLALMFVRDHAVSPSQKALILGAIGRILETVPNIDLVNNAPRLIIENGAAALGHAHEPGVAAALRRTLDLFTRRHLATSVPAAYRASPAAVAAPVIQPLLPPLLVNLQRHFAQRTWDEQLNGQLELPSAQNPEVLAVAADFAACGVENSRPDAAPVCASVARFVRSERDADRWHPVLLVKTMHMMAARSGHEVKKASVKAIMQLATETLDAPISSQHVTDLLCSMAALPQVAEGSDRARWVKRIATQLFAYETNTVQRLRLIRTLNAGSGDAVGLPELQEPFATLANPLAAFESRRQQFFAALQSISDTEVPIMTSRQHLFIENLTLLMVDDRHAPLSHLREHGKAFRTVLDDPRIAMSYQVHHALLIQALKLSAQYSPASPSDQARCAIDYLLTTASKRKYRLTGEVAERMLRLLESREMRALVTSRPDLLSKLQRIKELGYFPEPAIAKRLDELLTSLDPFADLGEVDWLDLLIKESAE